ncbi:hypothetical protein Bca4012_065134 [Brassica carinata]
MRGRCKTVCQNREGIFSLISVPSLKSFTEKSGVKNRPPSLEKKVMTPESKARKPSKEIEGSPESEPSIDVKIAIDAEGAPPPKNTGTRRRR